MAGKYSFTILITQNGKFIVQHIGDFVTGHNGYPVPFRYVRGYLFYRTYRRCGHLPATRTGKQRVEQ
jgi:hypothetical protein